MRPAKKLVASLAVLLLVSLVTHSAFGSAPAGGGSITYEPGDGPGGGKHTVFVCGEWEHRCEESLPIMARILADRHGFKCTVESQTREPTALIQ